MSLTGDGYKGPFVTDIIVVKGLRCPAGYVLVCRRVEHAGCSVEAMQS
jgi:hypothetical protein